MHTQSAILVAHRCDLYNGRLTVTIVNKLFLFRSGSFRDRQNASIGVVASPKPKIGTTFRRASTAALTPAKSTTAGSSRQVRPPISFRPVSSASVATSSKPGTAGSLRRSSVPSTGVAPSVVQPKQANAFNISSFFLCVHTLPFWTKWSISSKKVFRVK